MYDSEWRSRERAVLKSVKLLAMIWTVALGLAAFSRGAAAEPTCPRVDLTLVEPAASSQTRLG
jgi:hypothetical protein